jgi:DsbC/DsbD-like thiol-disulfide interchange protein
MAKRILLAIVFSVFASTFINGQISHAQWKLSTKKISDCEYDLIFTLTLDKGWHTFSITKIKDAGMEVFPTEIVFKPAKDYSLVGGLTETKPTPEYDKTIEKTVLLHYNKAVITQRIKLNSSGKVKISGRYEYQVCKEVCEKPPYEQFDFDLKGTLTCSK